MLLNVAIAIVGARALDFDGVARVVELLHTTLHSKTKDGATHWTIRASRPAESRAPECTATSLPQAVWFAAASRLALPAN